jgi:putative FmdB family regulatory protein
MPTYQYLCRNCEHRFDVVQSIHDEPLTVCPECAGTVRRVLHPVGVTFKGSGFYRTDSRSGSTPATGKAESAKKDAAAASSSGSSDSSGSGSSTGASSGSSTGSGSGGGSGSTAKASSSKPAAGSS